VARFSPDGRTLLTASADRTARLWDTATAQPTSPALQHEDRVEFAEFSRDGRWLVTASVDRTARVWDRRSAQPAGPILRHSAPVQSARFNSAGNLVVTASEDGTARLWDWRTGQPIGQPLVHRARVHWTEFSPDGRQVLTASEDGTVGLWDALAGLPIGPLLKHAENVNHAAFSPDGSAIATAGFDLVARIWPLAVAEGRAPDWLPELAEAVAGQRLNARRTVEDVPATRFLQLKSQVTEMQGQDAYSSWGRWFLADRSTRAVSPGAQRTVRQFEEDLLAPWGLFRDERFIRLHEALKLNPTNGAAYGRYAFALNRARKTSQTDLHAKGHLAMSAERPAGRWNG
jgi:dipeptidyl aminopeptidase/acylaminoacyl peptidase